MKHSMILLVGSLMLAGCAAQTPDEGAGQPSPPAQEQAAPPPAAEPAPPPPETTPQPAPSPSEPTAAKPVAPPPAPRPEKPAEVPPVEPRPKVDPAPAEKPKPSAVEEQKPAPPKPASQKPAEPPSTPMTKGVVVMAGSKLGAVRLEHKLHAERDGNTCASCHHPSKPEKPATAPQQACSDCHTTTAMPPMKTRLQAAFHDAKAQSGTCIDCHRKENAGGKKAPLNCQECHKR
jgi:hypothetical protein